MRPSGPVDHSTRTHSSAGQPCRPSPTNALGQDRPFALGAFLLRRRGAQLERPVRPGQRLVLVHRRLRHDLELGDRRRALAVRGADTVRAGVAAADHDDMLARRDDRPARARRAFVVAGVALVLLGQEVHREMDAVAVRGPGMLEVARPLGAAGQNHARHNRRAARSTRDVDADLDIGAEDRRLRPPSARRAGRSACLSILKSGMP